MRHGFEGNLICFHYEFLQYLKYDARYRRDKRYIISPGNIHEARRQRCAVLGAR